MIFTVTLNPALDYIVRVDRLRYDDICRTTAEELQPGGKGINVSTVLAALGVPSRALGFLAGFSGREVEDRLRAKGIDCAFEYLDGGNTRINVKVRGDSPLEINAGGPPITDADIDALMCRLDGVGAGDCLVLAGSVPSSMPDDIYSRIMARLRDSGAMVVVDAEGELLRSTLEHHPFLIKPNHHELGALFGIPAEDEDSILRCAAALQDMGARNVLVSRGGDGAILLAEDGSVHRASVAAGRVVSTVGCGDSMVAGFVAGWMQSGDYDHALTLGTACGCATAFCTGLADGDGIRAQLDAIMKK